MTITFDCPGCGGICAFRGRYAGRTARCIRCNQQFVIPSENDLPAEKIGTEFQYDDPVPGFFAAAVKNIRQTFFNCKNATGLLFVVLLVCLKFVIRHENCDYILINVRLYVPLGLMLATGMMGCLFWYYMEIVSSTAFGNNDLPDIDMGTPAKLFGSALSCLYRFLIALAVVQTPFIVAWLVLAKLQIQVTWLLYALSAAGLFVFPIAILTMAVGGDLSLLARPDYLIRPIVKAFLAYLVPAAMVIAAAFFQWKTFAYGLDKGQIPAETATLLSMDIAAAMLAVLAMRTTGLFYRHYSCHMTW